MEKRTRGGLTSIQDALQGYLKSKGLKARPLSGKVFSAWRKAVGEQLGKRAIPVKFQNGELTLEVESATHLQELQNFTGEGFRVRANEILGDEHIKRVAFRRRK